MEINFISKDDLENFKNEIINMLKTVTQNTVSKKYLRSSEVREMLKISPGTLQNMRIQGYIPYSKIGKTILYNQEDIQKVIEENRVIN